jgi:hypothetical protein
VRDPGLYVVVTEVIGGLEVRVRRWLYRYAIPKLKPTDDHVRRRLKSYYRYAFGEDGIPRLQHTDDLSTPFEDVQRAEGG